MRLRSARLRVAVIVLAAGATATVFLLSRQGDDTGERKATASSRRTTTAATLGCRLQEPSEDLTSDDLACVHANLITKHCGVRADAVYVPGESYFDGPHATYVYETRSGRVNIFIDHGADLLCPNGESIFFSDPEWAGFFEAG